MEKSQRTTGIEIWGGLECTINRIGETYFDQIEYSGHYNRIKDIELFAGLGIKTLRYPVLWEYHSPKINTAIDWSQTEKKLAKIRELNINPIAGLVHHGCGPREHEGLLFPFFAEGLKNYASEVAKKFPWMELYTPVNEPLTTARFSGLYGIWYPHKKDALIFARMFLNECKAIVLAMKAIREVNPLAKLVQTEDLGKTYSTPLLQYQADFENERRWLTFDLLCGKLSPDYPMWDYLIWLGIEEKELFFFIENPCTPEIIGVNHYVTSERFLDERLENYPSYTHGGNTTHGYADVEALRVNFNKQQGGLKNLIKELWDRYKLPISITEVHLSCTREEQMRWLLETWEVANSLLLENVDIRAITPWALLGSFGWNKLLTTEEGEYETGVFDVRSSRPRPTALAKMIKSLAMNGAYDHPVLQEQGWWNSEKRFLYHSYITEPCRQSSIMKPNNSKPVLIIGKNGTLGSAFARICERRGINYRILSRAEMDITNVSDLERVVKELNPWAIINAAGFVRIDDAETEFMKCFKDNSEGPECLAILCKKFNIKLLTFSSDLVFNGEKQTPYLESDFTSPLNIYGQSKAKADKNVLMHNSDVLIVRTSAFFGPWDKFNFVTHTLQSLINKQYLFVPSDVFISPTYVPDLVNCCLDLLIDDEKGIWHLSNSGAVTWSDLAIEIAARINYNTHLIHSIPLKELNLRAARPYYSVLNSEKGILLPSLEKGLNSYFKEQETIKI